MVSAGAKLLCQVLLVSGAFGEGTSSWFLPSEDYFESARRSFEKSGCQVDVVHAPPDAGIAERALYLRTQWERLERKDVPPSKRIWVTHSLGALDARYALSVLKVKGVGAWVSLGAPQNGSALADWAQKQVDSQSLIYQGLKWILNYDLALLRFVPELRPEVVKRVSERMVLPPGLRTYYAEISCGPHCPRTYRWLSYLTGVSEVVSMGDGVVSVTEQKIGESIGKFRLDHVTTVDLSESREVERLRLWSEIRANLLR